MNGVNQTNQGIQELFSASDHSSTDALPLSIDEAVGILHTSYYELGRRKSLEVVSNNLSVPLKFEINSPGSEEVTILHVAPNNKDTPLFRNGRNVQSEIFHISSFDNPWLQYVCYYTANGLCQLESERIFINLSHPSEELANLNVQRALITLKGYTEALTQPHQM